MCQAGPVTVRVGFIGSAHSIARLDAAEAPLPGIELRSYAYTDPHDTRAQYAAALAENDVVCFSGTLAHYHRDRSLDGEIPPLVGRFSDYTLAASLLAATTGAYASPAVAASPAALRRAQPLDVASLSIDLPNPEVAATLAGDTGLELARDQVFDYRWVYQPQFSRPVAFDEIVAFHLDRSRAHGARLAITSVHAVFDRLAEADVPAMYMIDSIQRDLDLLRAAQLRVSVRRLEGGLLAVVTLSAGDPDLETEASARRRAALSETLGRFATPVQHRLAAWQRGGLEMFYTTRGELDSRLPALRELLMAEDAPSAGGAAEGLALGVGIGQHLYEAEDRSMQALRRASAAAGDAAWMVDEDSRVHDLRTEAGAASGSGTRHTAPWLVDLAARAGMQSRSLTRLLEFLAARDFRPFTSAEWAASSQTSARTAERTVRKLLDAGAVIAVGQEKSLDAGRPRTVYGLSADTEDAARRFVAQDSRPVAS